MACDILFLDGSQIVVSRTVSAVFADEATKRKGSVAASPSQIAPGSASSTTSAEEPVIFYSRWCKQCGLCAAFCAQGAIEVEAEGDPVLSKPERCNSCGLCEVLCPDFAIAVPARHAKT